MAAMTRGALGGDRTGACMPLVHSFIHCTYICFHGAPSVSGPIPGASDEARTITGNKCPWELTTERGEGGRGLININIQYSVSAEFYGEQLSGNGE